MERLLSRELASHLSPNRPSLFPPGRANLPLFLIGVAVLIAGWAASFVASAIAIFFFLSGNRAALGTFAPHVLISGGVAVLAGGALCLYELYVLIPRKTRREFVPFDEIRNPMLTVVLTAYNDELSIGEAVRDFIRHPLVRRVIVVDNNSKDRTSAVAAEAGATVFRELQPGYGKCVFRALSEGFSQGDTDLTLLCEGDGTFSSFDIDKFMAYIPHAEIVNGTRIVEQLRDRETQLTTFMYYGNFVVGKLLEVKHLGKGTFTDVGTTYKLCRNSALSRLLPKLNSDVNLEFNAHFLDTALQHHFALVECPITFHKRIGVSKGGNTDDIKALKVGLRMIGGILFSWKTATKLPQ